MNTANMQLEGVYAVIAAVVELLLDKAVLTEAEMASMLTEVERSIVSGAGRPAEIRNSNIAAMCFPVRFLKLSLQNRAEGRRPSFAEIAAQIGKLRAE